MRWSVGLLVLIGCGGVGDDEGADDTPRDMTFVTYNAGLAVGFVPGAPSRTPLVADALAGLDADVVCLQEVWLPEQVAAVSAATASAFPHRFFPAAQQASDLGCDVGGLDALADCADSFCGEACEDEIVDCVFASCPIPFITLPRDCMRCVMANVGGDAVDVVQDVCERDPVAYAYGGSFGTGILSKHPISEVDELVFDSTTNRRSALHAVVDAPGGPIDVYCTHLSAVFSTIPYPRDTGSWAEEQAAQIQALISWTHEATSDTVVWMGDLNTGPGAGDIPAEVEENWALVAAAGFEAPYLEGTPACTYCADNPLLRNDDGTDALIDHVLTRGLRSVSAERVLDQTVGGAQTCGDPLEPAALSDHYGVAVHGTPGSG